MEGCHKKGRRFGQRRPTLTESIQNILERYPDGGQILKELIQNADDAGATEVNFLYDNRYHGTTSLQNTELAKFQGPALYCHNDVTFKEEDWEGIQNLMRSNKKDDPLKIGRFGIGFNSVYHITDLPGVVSGETVGFLDPHEKYFEDESGKRESGKRYDINENLLDPTSSDQFLPFHGIFGSDLNTAKSYDGTLFRFPLRTTPSDLSKKKYTKEMIDNLFHSLHQEASVILLFLKSVQSIKIHERNEDGEIECVFKVEVAEDTREDVRRKRKAFLNKAKESTITESRYIMSIQVTFGSQNERYRWLIVNQIGSTEQRIAELAEELCLLPWIGIAVPIAVKTNNASSGRIFCFLPLPPDVDCHTGLPVHVHGYFGLTDNRRGLVWPGDECQNTATAEWNELLLKKIAVDVYCKILEALIQDVPSTGIGQEQRSQLIYSRLPALAEVQGHWKVLLEPLFQKLILESKKLFYAQRISGNSWITLNEGILDRLQESGIEFETLEVILKILLNSSQVLVTNVPPHVLEIVASYFPPPRVITPTLLRSVLKRHNVNATSHDDKVLLLDFILRDDPTGDLNGTPLLPLANKQFAMFRPHSHAEAPSTSVFVPTSSCTAMLLPNMSHRFLNENLPDVLRQKFIALSANDVHSKNPTQLVRLTKDIVLKNLRSSLPSEWFNGPEKVQWIPGYSNHPAESWLKEIWNWINLSFPNTLSPFENLPLVELPPLPTTTDKCLGFLSKHSRFIFASDGSGNVLPSQVTGLLTAAGCTVLSNPPSYIHHQNINMYIAPPTAAGAISVISRASLQSAQEYIKLSTSKNRSTLREFFTRLPEYLAIKHRHFLRQLPLFDTLLGSCTTVQVNGEILNAASPEFSLPSGFNFRKSDQLISSTDPNTHQLLTMLTVQILKPAEVFLRYLFPNIRAKFVYSLQETSTIMLWILHQMFNFKTQCKEFHNAMKALPFVSTDKGHLKKPSELYDPNDALLSNLFLEETNKFPSKEYNDGHVISTLKDLGLQTKTMLTAGELLRVAESIESSLGSSSSICKVRALVEILQENSTYLHQDIDWNATLKDKLLQLKWLPSVKVPPQSWRFPAFMPWFNSDKPFFSPDELRNKSHALLVGSSMPIVDVEMNDELQEDFGLTVHPPIRQVVSQLNTAVKVWQQQGHRKATSQFQEMLVAIYFHLAQKSKECVSIAINDPSLKQWIWHGTGFCSPAQIALEKDFLLDLQPQLFLLPEDFKHRPSLVQFFLNNGVRKSFSKEDILTVLKDMKDKPQSSLAGVDASSEVLKNLKLCRSILEWIVKDGKTLGEELQKKVFVPVQSTKDMLVLEPCAECTYYDREWLRGESDLIIPEDYKLIHNSIPAKVARLLGVPALSTSLLSAETLGFEFEQTGPYEPLTTRLNNILKEYKEGVGIFKELIQNADDAGASKVRFLVDWRQGPTEKLLSPKMVECQGPALWAYNDAVFTDKDFENINKLAGATKLEDLCKIGRFGLGFSAVYHLTDVPSFISRESVVIFDPNLNHLEWIKDKSRPGIRINLSTNPVPLRAFADQFQPYHNIFDCEIQEKYGENFYYDGTLFRFPFRTPLQKEESKISQSVYDEEKVKVLVYSLRETIPHLLLYTQHVNQVELYVLSRDNGPEDMELELSVTKDTPQNLRNENRLSATFIEECSSWWQKKLASPDSFPVIPSRFELVEITIQDNNTYSLPGSTRAPEKRELWFLTSCVGTDSSVEMARNEGRNEGLLPYAGAAVKISHAKGGGPDDLLSYYPESLQGEAFCFLPLSLPTGLPVHLNAFFAITSNRRGIWERDTVDHCQPIEVQWNECLMKDPLSNAYIQLLENMKRISENGTLEFYDFHMLWPYYDSLCSTMWETLVKSFYDKLVENALPLFCSDGKWLSIHEGYILDEQLQKVGEVAEILKYLKWSIFQLPPNVCASLEKSGHGPILAQRTLTLEKFLHMVFLPNINKISPRLRDALLCHCLDLEDLGSFFEGISCICCSPDGRHLAKPSELIHPNGAAAILFSEEDRRFPIGEYFLTEKRAFALEQLGMVKDLLSWDDIHGRAESVEKLSDFERSRERAKNLVKYLEKNIENLTKNDEAIKILQRTKFLPIKSEPPDGYFLPWKGSEHKNQFGAPVDLFLSCDKDLVGSSCLIVDNSNESLGDNLSQKVIKLLEFSGRHPEIEQVIQQLDTVIRVWTELNFGDTNEWQQGVVESVCKRVYEYFEDFVSQRNEQQPQSYNHQDELDLERFLTLLKQREWIFIRGKFSSSEKVAIVWEGNAVPFLYHLPDEYRRAYKNLWSAAGVRNNFEKTDFIHSLYALQNSKKSYPLCEEELKLVVCFLNELKDVENETIKQHIGKIPLPDTNKILQRGDSLTINQTFWLQASRDTRYVHPDIPQERAFDLGARSLQNRILKKYSKTIGTSFGQQEKLTDRLKSILHNYPCDSGIFKELVQNADDAEASEIHFVYDTRELPSERVFQKNATEIQGPALCVYNDRPFKEEDLMGITKLGIGSKGGDPEKTGQYGIGFNAVYHLTDCPSFLSNDETLVLLDPHCRYAPEATQESPGGKFHPIDDDFRKNFADAFLGYLGEYFNLKGCTMFRLPLRTSGQSPEAPTPIAEPISNEDMNKLFDAFQNEAMKTLLFLNHIKKITLSKIGKDNNLEPIYEVNSVLDKKHEKQRRKISSVIKAHKKTPTRQIPWESQMYPMTISDCKGDTESWLVHQCCGTQPQSQIDDYEIPNGQCYGRFPRGGIAALLSSSLSSTDRKQPLNVAYCGLPLPVHTHLPVAVNGNFALGSSRRGIWRDTEPNRELTKWNDFIKSRVLAPGYAALICSAQNYIPHCERSPNKVQCYFPDSETAKIGLDWYFELFPDVSTDPEWELLAIEVYRCLGTTRAKVLPVVVGETQQSSNVKSKYTSHSTKKFYTKEPKSQSSSELNKEDAVKRAEKMPQKIRQWLPADQGYFITEESKKPEKESKKLEEASNLLLRICLPLLLHTPIKLYNGFQKADVVCCVTSPLSVMEFLRTFRNKDAICDIGHLPTTLKQSRFRSREGLHKLIKYCKEEKRFSSLLEGLPLLLTADDQLRIFDSKNPVYRSQFSDLFPRRRHLFTHPKFVSTYYIPKMTQSGKQEISAAQVTRDFTLGDLVQFMPDVFPPSLQGVVGHVVWSFNEGLSKERLTRLWEYLRSHADSEAKEDPVSLEPLNEWPIIPTTCGKLVTISDAKTVFDMTETGTETERERKVREIIRKLKCPSLDNDITREKSREASDCKKKEDTEDIHLAEKASSTASTKLLYRQAAVTDTYVAHPHKVADILQVLDHMRRTGILDVSVLSADEIRKMLMFFQDEFNNLNLNNECEEILKDLPLHKTIHEDHVSLSVFSSSAFVPAGVPLDGIKQLQSRTGCLFLHWDALESLTTLYESLGTRWPKRSASKFYIDFILPHFSIFHWESQMKYLDHIKHDLQTSWEKKELLKSLRSTRCVPNQQRSLDYAKNFFDPRDKVFEVMLPPNKFPLAPFNDQEWLDFFIAFGLHKDFRNNDDLFFEFCTEVARIGGQSLNDDDYELNVQRSKQLVERLKMPKSLQRNSEFPKENLQDRKFLFKLSTIKFIASEKVTSELSSIHKQYQCTSEHRPPFISYRESVPCSYQNIAWTTAKLLPKWAQPGEELIESHLQISKEPTLDAVVKHMENICNSLAETTNDGDLPAEVQEIMNSIYSFLSKNVCPEKEVSDRCNGTCKDIGRRFNHKPCVYVEGTLIKGEQLSFKLPGIDLLNPFLYTIPRDYGSYEHLLKRLGATEKVTSLQLANLLKAIKDCCQDGKMDSNHEKKAQIATVLLLKCNYRESSHSKEASKISNLTELFLPSDSQFLVKSTELVSTVPLRLVPVISKQNWHVLFPLEEHGLPRACTEKYLASLPEHLRPVPLDCIVREMLDPSCRDATCMHCLGDSVCSFMKKYLNILRSKHFQEGMARVLLHQKTSNKFTEEEEERSSRFLDHSKVEIKCMEIIKIYLVDMKTQKPLEEDYSQTNPGYIDRRDDGLKLYIVHETKSLGFLTKLVNEVMDSCIEDKYLPLLTDILQCDSPSQISELLTDRDITPRTISSMVDLWSDESEDDSDEAEGVPGPSNISRTRNAYLKVPETCYRIPVDRREAFRWMKQSLSDLEAAKFMLTADPPFNALACFHSHEAVEKSLKALLYAKYDIDSDQLNSHRVDLLANDIENQMVAPSNLSSLAESVKNYYVPPRYPNVHRRYVVPAEAYDQNQARIAIENATTLVEMVKTLINWYF